MPRGARTGGSVLMLGVMLFFVDAELVLPARKVDERDDFLIGRAAGGQACLPEGHPRSCV